ncbi:MAG: hypothetical protein KKF27_20155, partial [Gammaproteobacteria bacterium]|nr:hypothetical protein [Gammaproteobacteria bacterium]
ELAREQKQIIDTLRKVNDQRPDDDEIDFDSGPSDESDQIDLALDESLSRDKAYHLRLLGQSMADLSAMVDQGVFCPIAAVTEVLHSLSQLIFIALAE